MLILKIIIKLLALTFLVGIPMRFVDIKYSNFFALTYIVMCYFLIKYELKKQKR